MRSGFQNIFGGYLLKNANAREARPFQRKTDVHLTFAARTLLGRSSFLNPSHQRAIQVILRRQARQQNLQIKAVKIEASKIHVVLKASQRKDFLSFLRAVPGLISRKVLGAEKGTSLKTQKKEGLWIGRPLSAWLSKSKRSNYFLSGNWLKDVSSVVLASDLEGAFAFGPEAPA